jgi:hypothetical protein
LALGQLFTAHLVVRVAAVNISTEDVVGMRTELKSRCWTILELGAFGTRHAASVDITSITLRTRTCNQHLRGIMNLACATIHRMAFSYRLTASMNICIGTFKAVAAELSCWIIFEDVSRRTCESRTQVVICTTICVVFIVASFSCYDVE